MSIERGFEKVPMTSAATPVQRSLPAAANPQVQSTRRTLRVLLGICLALSVLGSIGAIGRGMTNQGGSGRFYENVAGSLLSILFYAFGIIAANRYYQTGLRVFAWLGIINLFFLGVLLGILSIAAVAISFSLGSSAVEQHQTMAVILAVFVVLLLIIFAVHFVLMIIIVKLSFKLARAIDASSHVIMQQL